MTSAKAWGIDARLLTPAEVEELRPVRRPRRRARRLLHAERVGRRLAAGRHADAPGGDRQGRADGARQHRGRSTSRSPTARSAPSSPTRAGSRPSTSSSPAACGARASRRWPERRSRSRRRCTRWSTSGRSMCSSETNHGGRLPDRPRHGHVLLRAPDRRVDGGRLVRPPADLPPPRRHPVDRGVGAVAHRAAVHRRRLRRPDGAGDRADGDARRRRDQVRDQRPAVAHPGRDAGARRDGRGAQPVVGGGGVDQGGAGHRPARRRVDDPRLPAPLRPALVGHQPLLPTTSAPSTTSTPAAPSTTTRPTASSTRASSGRASGACGAARSSAARRRSAPCSSTPAAGSGRSGTSPTPTCSTATRRPARAAAARVGQPLVVADHQRRAPPPARARRDGRPHARSTSSTSTGPGAVDYLQRMCVNNVDVAGRPLGVHAAAHAGRRVPRRPDDHAPRRASTSASSPARSTAAATSYWFRRHLPADGSVTFTDRTSGVVHDRRVGTAGGGDDGAGRHRLVAPLRPRPRTAFPYGSVRDVLIDGVPCTMFRISYVGESGWEVYTDDRARAAGVGHDLGGRPGARHPPGRASACTPSPGGSRRATG